MYFSAFGTTRKIARALLGLLTALTLLVMAPLNAAAFTVSTSSAPLSGLWWNPAESGWGISLTQQGPVVFAAWYTYDLSGAPSWYVMSSCAVAGNGCSGDIYSVNGGTRLGVAWNGAGKVVAKVGTGTFAFSDNDTGTFSYSLNGANGVKNIVRQVFASSGAAPAVDYSALWWNAAESGWGVALTQQYGVIFATIYTYDAAGKPIWYVASSCTVNGSGCTGSLYQVNGGSAPNVNWNGANKTVATVGTLSFAFTDAGNGTMNYIINGVSGSKAISKQTFYTAPSTSGGSDSSSCAGTALVANGASYQMNLRSSQDGSMVQESSNKFVVTSGVNFQGNSTIEAKVDTTITAGAGVGSTNTARNYFGQSATDEIAYGNVNQTSAAGFTVNSTITFTPAITYPRAQTVGGVRTQTYKASTTVSGAPVSLPATEITQTSSRKFLGIEAVTVAAGTFKACKFEDTVTTGSSAATVATIWFYSGGAASGTLLKQSSTAAGKTTVTELLSATMPGGGGLPAN